MKNPLVSIIMNCHNGEKFLRQSIKSVLHQSYKNWELIFYDNCSSDNSKQIIKNFICIINDGTSHFHYQPTSNGEI